jgi:hypothetical protein
MRLYFNTVDHTNRGVTAVGRYLSFTNQDCELVCWIALQKKQSLIIGRGDAGAC